MKTREKGERREGRGEEELLLCTYYVPSSILSALHILTHLILTKQNKTNKQKQTTTKTMKSVLLSPFYR